MFLINDPKSFFMSFKYKSNLRKTPPPPKKIKFLKEFRVSESLY